MSCDPRGLHDDTEPDRLDSVSGKILCVCVLCFCVLSVEPGVERENASEIESLESIPESGRNANTQHTAHSTQHRQTTEGPSPFNMSSEYLEEDTVRLCASIESFRAS